MPLKICAIFRTFRKKIFCCFRGHATDYKKFSEAWPEAGEKAKTWRQENVKETAKKKLLDESKPRTEPECTNDNKERLILDLQKALSETRSESEKADIYRALGKVYYDICVFETAKIYFQKYYELAKKLGSLILLQQAYYHLGCVNERLGCFRDAINNYELGLAASQKLNDLQTQAQLFNNMANTFEMMGNFERVIFYQNKRRKIAELLKDGDLESKACSSLGNGCRVVGDLRKSIMYYQRVVVLLTRKLGEVILCSEKSSSVY